MMVKRPFLWDYGTNADGGGGGGKGKGGATISLFNRNAEGFGEQI